MVVAPWTLVPRRWHDGDHTKTHKDGDLLREGPYHITLSMHVMFILLCILFCLVTIMIAAVAL
jgi:hypothetical protein